MTDNVTDDALARRRCRLIVDVARVNLGLIDRANFLGVGDPVGLDVFW